MKPDPLLVSGFGLVLVSINDRKANDTFSCPSHGIVDGVPQFLQGRLEVRVRVVERDDFVAELFDLLARILRHGRMGCRNSGMLLPVEIRLASFATETPAEPTTPLLGSQYVPTQ